jgi:hypothetical protein
MHRTGKYGLEKWPAATLYYVEAIDAEIQKIKSILETK